MRIRAIFVNRLQREFGAQPVQGFDVCLIIASLFGREVTTLATRKLLASTAVAGGMTLISRIAGLVRDMVFTTFIGASVSADAFYVAFRIPNFFRRIFGEGALSQAFVP